MGSVLWGRSGFGTPHRHGSVHKGYTRKVKTVKVTVSFDASNVSTQDDARALVAAIANQFNGQSVAYDREHANEEADPEGSFLTRSPWGRSTSSTLTNITFVSAE